MSYLAASIVEFLRCVALWGCPRLTFITLTTNTEWPELKEALPEGISVFEVPLTVRRVFKRRLDAFLHSLRSGEYFGGRKTEWIVHVTECQERGLPHAHIVCRLQNMSALIEWIDTRSSCPRPTVDLSDDLIRSQIRGQPHLHKVVYVPEEQ